jgi:hypothetical protein
MALIGADVHANGKQGSLIPWWGLPYGFVGSYGEGVLAVHPWAGTGPEPRVIPGRSRLIWDYYCQLAPVPAGPWLTEGNPVVPATGSAPPGCAVRLRAVAARVRHRRAAPSGFAPLRREIHCRLGGKRAEAPGLPYGAGARRDGGGHRSGGDPPEQGSLRSGRPMEQGRPHGAGRGDDAGAHAAGGRLQQDGATTQNPRRTATPAAGRPRRRRTPTAQSDSSSRAGRRRRTHGARRDSSSRTAPTTQDAPVQKPAAPPRRSRGVPPRKPSVRPRRPGLPLPLLLRQRPQPAQGPVLGHPDGPR